MRVTREKAVMVAQVSKIIEEIAECSTKIEGIALSMANSEKFMDMQNSKDLHELANNINDSLDSMKTILGISNGAESN